MFDCRTISGKASAKISSRISAGTSTAFLLFCVLLLGACNPSNNDANKAQRSEYKTTIFAFGTLINITLYDVSAEKAEFAFAQLEKDFQNYHHDWSPWIDGPLSQINRHFARGESFTLSDNLINTLEPLIKQGISLSKQSMGLFNPTIGNLINLWQFHKYDEADASPPSAQKIQTLLDSNPQVSDIQINEHTISSINPAVQLSLGAFAKGYGIQLAMNTLHDSGIHNAIINAGGDLIASGSHGNRAWNIGIRHPRQDAIIASVKIHDHESVFTSGDYERFYYFDNKRYHHILNPNTGYPTKGFSSVTVIHSDAATADAAATALMVAGPENWLKVAKNMNLQTLLLIDENNQLIMTTEMAKRISLHNVDAQHIKVSDTL